MVIKILVTMKPEVPDPQRLEILQNVQAHGFTGVTDARQGKYFEVEINVATRRKALRLAKKISERLLANPVIEEFQILKEVKRRGFASMLTALKAFSRGIRCLLINPAPKKAS